MAASMVVTVVEHIVLFRTKEEGVSQRDLKACMLRFRALCELEGVLFLQAGAARACQPHPSAWTHVLYGRFTDKASLHAYALHPAHLQAVAMADPLFQDKMALDWESPVPLDDHFSCTHIPKPSFAAAHIVFVEWFHPPHSPQLAIPLARSLATPLWPSSVQHTYDSRPRHTCGSNFSPARARGFHWGFAAVFDSLKPLQLDSSVQTLSCDPSVKRFLCLDFMTEEEEILARM